MDSNTRIYDVRDQKGLGKVGVSSGRVLPVPCSVGCPAGGKHPEPWSSNQLVFWRSRRRQLPCLCPLCAPSFTRLRMWQRWLVVADNVARSANAPKSAPVTMMRARTGWCNHPMMTLGQVWQTVQAKAASRDGLWAWQIGFANGHLRKTKERRKVDARINETHRG